MTRTVNIKLYRDCLFFVFQGAWLDHTREAPNILFENGNGFDVYVDCGRFFPDSTVASRVSFEHKVFLFFILFL